MKVLVTGGTGFIGSRLVRELAARGVLVRVLMRRTSSDQRLRGITFERVEGDLGDVESLKRAVKDVDIVFHLAAALAQRDPRLFFQQNTQGTTNLLTAIREGCPHLKRFVFTSSMAAGGPGKVGEPIQEAHGARPVSDYGLSKQKAEEEILKYKDTVPMVILRPPIVYGPGDANLLVALKPLKSGLVPIVRGSTGDRMKRYSVIYVGDLVEALILASEAPLKTVPSGEVFYSTHAEVLTMEEIYRTAAQVMGKKVRFIYIPFGLAQWIGRGSGWLARWTGKDYPLNSDKVKEIRPDYWVCSGGKAKQVLGFEAKTPFSVGFSETVRWYLESGWL